MVKPR